MGQGSLGEAVLDLSADQTQLKTDMSTAHSQVLGSLNKMTGGVNSFYSRTMDSFNNLASGVAKVTAWGFGLAGAAVAGFAGLALNLGGDAEEMISKFGVTFGEFAGSLENDLSKFGAEVGRSSYKLQGMAADVGAVFKGMGFTSEAAADMSGNLVKLAADVGSFNNLPMDDVLNRFSRAATGEFEALKALGIVINQSRIDHKLQEKGITENWAALDQLTRGQLVYEMLLESTTDAQGDALRTQGSFTNQMIRAKDSLRDMATTIGLGLTTLLTPLLNWFNEMIDKVAPDLIAFFSDFSKWLGAIVEDGDPLNDFLSHLPKGFQDLVKKGLTWIETGRKILDKFSAWFSEVWPKAVAFFAEHKSEIVGALKAIGIAFGALMIISTITSLVALLTNPLTILMAVVGLLGAAWAGNWGGIRDIVMSAWAQLKPIFEGLVEQGRNLAAIFVTNVLPRLKEVGAFLGGLFVGALKAVWNFIITSLLPAFMGFINFVSTVIIPNMVKLYNYFKVNILPVLQEVATFVSGLLTEAWTGITTFWNESVLPALTDLWDFISVNIIPLLNDLKELVEVALTKAFERLYLIWTEKILPKLDAIYANVSEFLLPILRDIQEFIDGALGKAMGRFAELWQKIKGGSSGVAGIIDAIRTAIQKLKDLLDKFDPSKLAMLEGHSPSPLAIGVQTASSALSKFLPKMRQLVGLNDQLAFAMAMPGLGPNGLINYNAIDANQQSGGGDTNVYLNGNYSGSPEDAERLANRVADYVRQRRR